MSFNFSCFKKVTLIGLITIFLSVSSSNIIAQETQSNQSSNAAGEQDEGVYLEELSEEQLLFYLANEKVAAAGVGFINGQLDDPMAEIIKIWGEPVQQRKTGLGGSIEFLYQPDPNTLVVFTGQEVVKTISIKGNSASILRTRRGARFGFTPINILRVYAHNEHKTKNNRIDFKSLGISFYFKNNKVDEIVVYAP